VSTSSLKFLERVLANAYTNEALRAMFKPFLAATDTIRLGDKEDLGN